MPEHSQAEDFLAAVAEDDALRRRIEAVGNRNLITVAVAVGRERGYEFSDADLVDALTSRLRLSEDSVEGAGGDDEGLSAAPGCRSRSGCRTPCLYCRPDEGNGGDEIILEL